MRENLFGFCKEFFLNGNTKFIVVGDFKFSLPILFLSSKRALVGDNVVWSFWFIFLCSLRFLFREKELAHCPPCCPGWGFQTFGKICCWHFNSPAQRMSCFPVLFWCNTGRNSFNISEVSEAHLNCFFRSSFVSSWYEHISWSRFTAEKLKQPVLVTASC